MTRILFTLCLMFFCAPFVRADAWDDVLALAGTSRAGCRFQPEDLASQEEGEFRTPLFNSILAEPLNGPFEARVMRNMLLGSGRNSGTLASTTANYLEAGAVLNLLGNPMDPYAKAAAQPGAFMKALEAVWAAGGRKPSDEERQRVQAELKSVPPDIERTAAFMLMVEIVSVQWRNQALQPAIKAGVDLKDAFGLLTGRIPQDQVGFPRVQTLQRTVDLKRLMVGGEMVAWGADSITAGLANRKPDKPFSFSAWTPLGWIRLRGSGNDVVEKNQPNLLIIDTGGDDIYRSGAATFDENYPVSVLIDLGGNDKYITDPAMDKVSVADFAGRKAGGYPAFGVGFLGYGVLVDAGGNDTFRALDNTQGRAYFGLGVLADYSGDDVYEMYNTGQGCGDFGVGILRDGGGNDRYSCFSTAQGYGGTKGFGLILDTGKGNDVFTALDKPLDQPSGQTPEHNNSMAQGVGNGRRADYLDGHSLAGGIGVLLDDGGNNTLSCGLFGQGAGYWMGVGMCLMGNGADKYNGVWYVQGSAAHFAVGILDDTGGNDKYLASHNMAMGAGHDYSVGWLIDHGGDDSYDAPTLALGGANACGMGFFWDKGGNDTYKAKPSSSMGDAGGGGGTGSHRERSATTGIFLDCGGKDAYPAEIPATGDGKSWKVERKLNNGKGGERGGGLDTEAPNLPEPR